MASDRLSARLGPIEMRSPLIAASGTVGSVWEWAAVADVTPFGAAVAKSVAPVEWPGRPAPRLAPAGPGMLNGIGIQNPGIEAWVDKMTPVLPTLEVPVWGSAVGETPDEFAMVAKGLLSAGVPVVEVNLSCPNLDDGRMFSLDAARAAEVIAAVAAAIDVPVGAKLSPNADDVVGVAAACLEAGATFLTLTNTLFGFGVDLDTGRPLLSGGVGGYSGPGLKPVSLRCVYEVASALPGTPIVGCGGVTTGADVVEYLLAGASAVAVGTVLLAEPRAGTRIVRELGRELDRRGVTLSALVGGVKPW
ncbi:MAG TPA: dihydroorotate dehydrogenase [Acidimicrobiia bacterium]|nr:dihydroorotate dehydrogenase [Acidimicrobiia bacterium]